MEYIWEIHMEYRRNIEARVGRWGAHLQRARLRKNIEATTQEARKLGIRKLLLTGFVAGEPGVHFPQTCVCMKGF